MTEHKKLFTYKPASDSYPHLARYVLISNPSVAIVDATKYSGGYCPGVANDDGTFTAYLSSASLLEAMQRCLDRRDTP